MSNLGDITFLGIIPALIYRFNPYSLSELESQQDYMKCMQEDKFALNS